MNIENNIKINCDVPALWLEHKDALRNFIRKRIKDEDTVNDISQEVLIKVYTFCMSKSGINNVRSWLFQIAQNTIIDYLRRQNKLVHDLPDLEFYDGDTNYDDASTFILPMIQFLPFEYAEPLRLADIEGIKQVEIAEKLGLTLSATKSRIQRARLLLKKEFLICCNFETDKFGNFLSFQVKDSCEPLQKIIQGKN